MNMMPSDPRFKMVEKLQRMLCLLLNPACDFFAAQEPAAEWAADTPVTRENIESELAKILGCARDG